MALSENKKKKALDIINKVNDGVMFGSGLSPKAVAAGAVHLATIMEGKSYNEEVKDIAAAAEVSKKSVYDNTRRLRYRLKL